MITLNGKKFAENNDEFISSLFKTGDTCDGYAKVLRGRIDIYNPAKMLIGSIDNFGGTYEKREKNKFVCSEIKLLGNYSEEQKHNDLAKIALNIKNYEHIKIYQYK